MEGSSLCNGGFLDQVLEVMAVYTIALTSKQKSYNGGFLDQMFEVLAVYTVALTSKQKYV